MPRVVTLEVDNNGDTVKEVSTAMKEGKVRDIQFGAHLSVDSAEALGVWLIRKAHEAREILKQNAEGKLVSISAQKTNRKAAKKKRSKQKKQPSRKEPST